MEAGRLPEQFQEIRVIRQTSSGINGRKLVIAFKCSLWIVFIIILFSGWLSGGGKGRDAPEMEDSTELPGINARPTRRTFRTTTATVPKVTNCTSPVCLEVLEQMKMHMNESKNPCDNFYGYACGGWVELSDVFGKLAKSNNEIINGLIKSLEPTTKSETKLKDFYASCLFNKTRDNDTGKITLKIRQRDNRNDYAHGKLTLLKLNCELECLVSTKARFPHIIARLFVQSVYADKGIQAPLSSLLENVRSSYLQKLYAPTWIDWMTNLLIYPKLQGIRGIVGHPSSILRTTKENEMYGNIPISPSNYSRNLEELDKHFASRLIGKTTDEVVEIASELYRVNYTVKANAIYLKLDDTFMIPAGIARKPFFHKDYPNVVNFARLGWVVGHELGHALYSYMNGGEFYWEFGGQAYLVTVAQKSTFKSKMNFEILLKCIESEYNLYKLNGLAVNGTATLEENFADLAATHVAYHAYFDNHPEEDKQILKGFEGFTKQQIFFIASAQNFCRKLPPATEKETLRAEIARSEHSSHSIRVFGQMRNSVEFAKAFNCHIGSVYNPILKCKVF